MNFKFRVGDQGKTRDGNAAQCVGELAALPARTDEQLRDEVAMHITAELAFDEHNADDIARAVTAAFDYADAFMAERARRYGK
jgi:hypothetical protein